MKKVLITGMSGLIGGILRRHLEELGGYELSALNRRPVEGVKCTQADLSDLEAITPAFEGVDVVVHLAAHVQNEPFEDIVNASIVGVRNVYEAARMAGVKRVVFASSGATVRGIEKTPPYDSFLSGRYEEAPESWPMVTHEMLHPDGNYAASKVFGEALGRAYADAHGISVLCVRIGSVRADNRPAAPREYSVYLSHRDVADFLHKCIEAPDDLMYDVFFATSKNKWGYRDIEHPRQVLGFVPQDSAESFR